ncbi:MAG: biosynthetic arginine decarboxylase [Bdellovibrionota bacterium]
MEKISIEQALNIYGMDSWGGKYFSISEEGDMQVHPSDKREDFVNVRKVVQELKRSRVQTPVILRFPQILAGQVNKLCKAFDSAIQEFKYKEKYTPVFPIKVNQTRHVVESLLQAGYSHQLGLEVGSKPELIASLGMDLPEEALTICNGFKDQSYFEMASVGISYGRKVLVVIEKPFELKQLLKLKESGMPIPLLGFRIKLQSKGSGHWEKSGGQASKFGMTTIQLLQAIDFLKQHELSEYLKLLHFHIGSQVTEIRKIKAAIKEAARIYAKVQKDNINIDFLDVGGGLGVDYDGSNTSSDASVNYSIEEYANDVVYTISEVCESEHVPHPRIISESGRALVTHHSMVVFDVRDLISESHSKPPVFSGKENQVVNELFYIDEQINVKNYREFYHDGVERKDELYSLFNLGMLDIDDRAKGEWLYWQIAQKAVRHAKTSKFVADEFVELEQKLYDKAVCNFSVFQSLPDHWAIDQLFPIMPIHRLNEKPSRLTTLVDITCDSDGEVDKFVDLKDIKHALEVHELIPDQPYYISVLMVGAYQDIMGDLHNLFGAVHDVEILVQDGKTLIKGVRYGDTIADTLRTYGYDQEKLLESVRKKLDKSGLSKEEAQACFQRYQNQFACYPYLDPEF